MDYSSRSGTLAQGIVVEQHPRTEYDKGFYKPPNGGLNGSRGSVS